MNKFLFYILLFFTFSCQEKVEIIITPANITLGDNIDIKVKGLEPNTEYDLYLTKLTFRDSFAMFSKATFVSNENGIIDIDKDESISGTFLGKDSLGLFYSIDSQSVIPNFLLFDEELLDLDNAHRNLQVVKDNKLIANKKFMIKIYDGKNIEHIHIEEDRIKLDFYKANESKNLIVVLGGSEGNNLASKPDAEYLASIGYNAVAISYFGIASQGYNLIHIPIERIDTSIMKVSEEMGGIDKLIIMGGSRGAELALIYGSIRPEVSTVMAFAPSCVPVRAISARKPAWTLKGEGIDFLDFEWGGKLTFNKYDRPIYKDFYYEPLKIMNKDLMIKIENIQGDILLFSGEDDDLWPAALMADMLEKRIKTFDFKYQFHNYKYKNAGNVMMGFPYLPTTWIGRYAYGGEYKENAYALLKNNQIVFEYLEQNFK